MPLSKKIFFISLSLLFLTLLLWGAYYFAFKAPEDQFSRVAEDLKEKKESLFETNENSEDETIATVSEDPVLSPVYLLEEKVIRYYSASDGRAYQIDADGKNRKTISSRTFPGLSSVIWSTDGSSAILKSKGDAEENIFYYYEYADKNEIRLKDNIDHIVWRDENRILYRYYDPGSREASLNISDPDGTDWSKITDTDFKDIVVKPVPQTGLISYWNPPSAQAETLFQSVSLLGTESRVIFSGRFGADYLWNRDGTKILVSHSDEKSGSKTGLAIIDSRGENYKNLEIPTLVSKAVWSRDNTTVYYALPGSIPETAVMPDDYMNGKFNTADTFWKVDVATGKKSRVVELKNITSNFDATNLFFNYDESVLYFVNKVDGKLYRINL